MRFRNFVKPMSEYSQVDAQMESPNAALPRRQSVSVTLRQLPPFDFARRLYASQFNYIGTIFSFLEPQVFERRLQWVYSQEPDLSVREDCLAYCQILMTFAFGQLYGINEWTGNDGPPGFDYFVQVLQILPDIYEEGSILFVEVLSLVGYYMQNLNRRDAAFLYIGLALRMAISLSLHQEVSDGMLELDAAEREHRRRAWWSIYSMDRILCVKSGNPITIADADIGVSLPSQLRETESDASAATVLSHYTCLSRILGKIMEGIYRKSRKSGSSLVASVQSIMNDLKSWHRDLPKELHVDFDRLEKHKSRESVSIFLHYYQCVNMTARPLLYYVVQRRLEDMVNNAAKPDWKDGLDDTTIMVIERCIAAARSSVTMLTAAAKHNLVATYGFMDGEHAFSAALVLVMINVAFPYDAAFATSMEAGLDVLAGMAERGNSHMRARHLLLMDLRSVIGSLPAPGGMFMPYGTSLGSGVESFDEDLAVPQEYVFSQIEPFNTTRADLDLNDMIFWDEVSGNIGISMDIDLIETARNLRGDTRS